MPQKKNRAFDSQKWSNSGPEYRVIYFEFENDCFTFGVTSKIHFSVKIPVEIKFQGYRIIINAFFSEFKEVCLLSYAVVQRVNSKINCKLSYAPTKSSPFKPLICRREREAETLEKLRIRV